MNDWIFEWNIFQLNFGLGMIFDGFNLGVGGGRWLVAPLACKLHWPILTDDGHFVIRRTASTHRCHVKADNAAVSHRVRTIAQDDRHSWTGPCNLLEPMLLDDTCRGSSQSSQSGQLTSGLSSLLSMVIRERGSSEKNENGSEKKDSDNGQRNECDSMTAMISSNVNVSREQWGGRHDGRVVSSPALLHRGRNERWGEPRRGRDWMRPKWSTLDTRWPQSGGRKGSLMAVDQHSLSLSIATPLPANRRNTMEDTWTLRE